MPQLMQTVSLLRPQQWIKNGFVLLPAFFAHRLNEASVLLPVLAVTLAFSLTSGAVYIFNDLKDIDQDRNHPDKRHRPLASGRVAPAGAKRLLLLSGLSGLALGWLVGGLAVLILLVVYSALNAAYSLRLKHIAIVDLCCIATGFVLRLFVGAQAVQVHLSHWIVLMTFLLALFLALAKRRQELSLFLNDTPTRRSLEGYTIEFLSSAMVLMAGVTIVCYIMYTVSPETIAYYDNENIFLSAFWVLLGILRYMQLSFVYNKGESPTSVLFQDRFLQVAILGWLATLWLMLYAFPH